ncbi:MAG: aldo/keto reductase [Chloroflexota bacterium]|nr:aldo/keto reductase [Chloroflexota bacterium]
MEYRLVGGSDLKVSALSLGTATFGGGNEFFKAWGETDVAEATSLVDIALDAGITLFDSADAYSSGLAEEILGKAIAGRRGRLLISTKAAFRTGPGPDEIGSSRTHLIQACEASLRRLGTDHIDLWQLHAFDAMTPIEETLHAMDDLVRAGKVRYIGCSNFSGWHLMKSLALSAKRGWARYVAHQAYYSLLAREYEWELMPLALDQQVGTVVWSPLSGGRLSGKFGRNEPAPKGSRTATLGAHGTELPLEQLYAVVDVLREIGADLGRSVSQIALNWLLQRPTVASLVIGARNAAQLRENLGSIEFKLTGEQVKRLDEVSASQPIYPYWHQRQTFAERNPPPVA